MAIDPICGMQVEETTRLNSEYDGVIYYFCSKNCQQHYQIQHLAALLISNEKHSNINTNDSASHGCCDPESELGGKNTTTKLVVAAKSHKYFCPM